MNAVIDIEEPKEPIPKGSAVNLIFNPTSCKWIITKAEPINDPPS